MWKIPRKGWMKWTYSASRDNPQESAYNFYVRNHKGNLIYVEASIMGIGANMEADTWAVLNALRYCRRNDIKNMIVEKNHCYEQR